MDLLTETRRCLFQRWAVSQKVASVKAPTRGEPATPLLWRDWVWPESTGPSMTSGGGSDGTQHWAGTLTRWVQLPLRGGQGQLFYEALVNPRRQGNKRIRIVGEIHRDEAILNLLWQPSDPPPTLPTGSRTHNCGINWNAPVTLTYLRQPFAASLMGGLEDMCKCLNKNRE